VRAGARCGGREKYHRNYCSNPELGKIKKARIFILAFLSYVPSPRYFAKLGNSM
jgi:hypothetical protein